MLFKSLLMPHINYCLPIYGHGKGANKLATYMKWGLRICCNLRYNGHTNNSFKFYRILKFEDQRNLQTLLLGMKFINNQLPKMYSRHLTYYVEKNRRKNIFEKIMPNHKTKSTIFETLPHIWNSFNMQPEVSVNTFKKKFKEKCFLEYEHIRCTKKNCFSCGTLK